MNIEDDITEARELARRLHLLVDRLVDSPDLTDAERMRAKQARYGVRFCFHDLTDLVRDREDSRHHSPPPKRSRRHG